MSLAIQIDTRSFGDQLARLRRETGKTGTSTVRYWSRIMLRKLAFKTSIATGRYRNRGRLRAGWWPAAAALNVGTVYSGSFGNRGEGSCIDQSNDPERPSITMINSVTFAEFVPGIFDALQSGADEVEARARVEWEKLIQRDLSAAGFA